MINPANKFWRMFKIIIWLSIVFLVGFLVFSGLTIIVMLLFNLDKPFTEFINFSIKVGIFVSGTLILILISSLKKI